MNKQLLIRNCMLATFFNDGYNATKILEHVDILIENGKILCIDHGIEAPKAQVIDATGKLAVPGFVNGWHRAVASLVSKSIAADVKCTRFGDTPLYFRVNPFVNIAQEVLTDAQLKDLLRLSLYQTIESGTTSVLEYCSVRELPLYLELCEELGMRTVACPALMSRKRLPEMDAWGNCCNELETVDEAEMIAWNKEQVLATKGKLASAGIGLSSVETASESLMREAGKAAFALDCTLMVAANETKQERETCLERYAMTPVQVLHKNHVLHRKTVVGGNQYAEKADRITLRSGTAAAALCPVQSLHDAQVAPFLDHQYDGIEILVGSGTATADMTRQVQALTLAGKLERRLRHQMRAQKTFFAVTTGGAQAASLPVGELEEGCPADFMLVNLANPHYHPFTMPITDLIYETAPSDITEVIVNGRVLKENGRVLGMDADDVVCRAEQAMEAIWTHARETGVL